MPNLSFPRLIKKQQGALMRFESSDRVSAPVIIPFQFNPETMQRSFSPWKPPEPQSSQASGQTQVQANPVAQPWDPAETIKLKLEFDATDELEFPELFPNTVSRGVEPRLTALVQLIAPQPTAPTQSATGPQERLVPVVFFSWGPRRTMPVRITEFSINEQAFNPNLLPIRAEVDITMLVLTDQYLQAITNSPAVESAKAVYRDMKAQLNQFNPLEALGTASPASLKNQLQSAVSSALASLPF